MASGRRALVINNLERAVSTDINRLQAFSSRDDAEIFRQLLDVVTDDIEAGYVAEPTAATLDQGAEIFGGLMVRPAIGSLSLLVDAGVMMIVAPDGGPDDSNYKLVRDVGVTTPGTLLMTANASGSIRIDVIECRVNPVPTVVTDSRDIYDPVTNLFTPAVVTKETAFRLEYRVRAGTPGSGFPGTVVGWVPLAVASVPNGTTINDTITFWDVRPLVSDRERVSAIGTSTGSPSLFVPRVDQADFRIYRAGAADVRLNGRFRAVINGRRVGGIFRRGSPGTDNDYINIADAANADSAGVPAEPLTGNVFVYAVFPFSLPRWAKYADAPSARIPRATKGILVSSYALPDVWGHPAGGAVIGLPTVTGLGATPQEIAVCVAIAPRSDANAFVHVHATNRVGRAAIQRSISTPLAGAEYLFSVAGADWAPNAKALYAQFVYTVTVAATTIEETTPDIQVYDDATLTFTNSNEQSGSRALSNFSGAPAVFTVETVVQRLPLPVRYPDSPVSPRTIRLRPFLVGGSTLSATASMRIWGYEL